MDGNKLAPELGTTGIPKEQLWRQCLHPSLGPGSQVLNVDFSLVWALTSEEESQVGCSGAHLRAPTLFWDSVLKVLK